MSTILKFSGGSSHFKKSIWQNMMILRKFTGLQKFTDLSKLENFLGVKISYIFSFSENPLPSLPSPVILSEQQLGILSN